MKAKERRVVGSPAALRFNTSISIQVVAQIFGSRSPRRWVSTATFDPPYTPADRPGSNRPLHPIQTQIPNFLENQSLQTSSPGPRKLGDFLPNRYNVAPHQVSHVNCGILRG